MARMRLMQNALNAGEWSPRLDGRSDLEKYPHALKTMLNAYAFKHGGGSRRPGTRFIHEVKDSTAKTRLISFESAYGDFVIEMGAGYLWYYKDNEIVASGGVPVELTVPYAEGELFEVQIASAVNILYLAHPNHPPQYIQALDTGYLYAAQVDIIDGPYLPMNTDAAHALTPSDTTGEITLTATGFAPFAAGHLWSLWRLKIADAWGYVQVIEPVTSSTVVTCLVLETLGGTDATADWREGSWSGERGWPRAVTTFQQRAVYAGTEYQPQTVWGSQANTFRTFDEGTGLDNEAYEFTLASGREIRWLHGHRLLMVGCKNKVLQLGGPAGEAITPSNYPDEYANSAYGASTVQPVGAHNAMLFVQRSGKAVREMVYELASDSYVAPDLSILAEHVTREGAITQIAYQDEPDSILWCVRADGALLGVTYERPNGVVAWHRHFTGAAQDLSDGVFESVAVIPHPDGDQDQVWVIVKRKIEGAWKRYVEYLDNKGGYYGAVCVDSALLYSGSATDEITGLDHLEGQTVAILGNGLVYPTQAVWQGKVIGLSPPVTEAEVGLAFLTELTPLRPELTLGTGTIQTAKKRYSDIFVRVYQSLGFTVNGHTPSLRDAADPMDAPVPAVTRDVRVTDIGWDRDGYITIRQAKPLPLTVLAIVGVLTVSED